MKSVIVSIICVLAFISCQNKSKHSNIISLNENQSQLEESRDRGQIVYEDMCITCHLANGKGVTNVFPPLANSDYLRKNQIKSIKAVKNGMSGEIVVNGKTYNNMMAPLGLNNEEVADVMNYINNSWGNTIDNFITPEKVSEL